MFMPTSDLPAMRGTDTAANVRSHFPIKLSGLCFETTRKKIIDSLSVSFADVPCTAIIGHNGAGKSVLLRLLHGLLSPSSGAITWGEQRARSKITAPYAWQAMVFQKPLLLNRSVGANLRFVLKRQAYRGAELEIALQNYLALADLEQAVNRPARVLSGGEAQRLAIVRALAMGPHLLFLDEPTASLDPAAKSSVEQLLKKIMDEGVRLILVTQDVGQAERLANDIVVMHEGRVVESGPALKVLNTPQSAEANAFLKHQI